MPRPRTGGAVFRLSPTGKHYRKNKKTGERERGDWYARVKWKDENGVQKSLWKAAQNRNDAADKLRQLLDEIDRRRLEGETPRRGAARAQPQTFAAIAALYKERYLKEAVYLNGRKISGLRSLDSALLPYATVLAHFGSRNLRAITYGDIEDFKAQRLALPVTTRYKDPETREWRRRPVGERTLASVHRDLAMLRRILRFAEREKFIDDNPFTRGPTLISPGDEVQRQRILTSHEEAAMLAACDAPDSTGRRLRAHLRPILICALDTGMRRGEILKLTWEAVNLNLRQLTIIGFNTKTLRPRTVPISERLAAELHRLFAPQTSAPDQRVFGYTNNVKRSFQSVCRIAGVSGLRFHDLRHTAATRLAQHGLSIAEIGRLLGHTQPQTTYRYISSTTDTLDHAKRIFDGFNPR